MTLRKKYSKIRKCVIYEIVCNITGERYIGSTISKNRLDTHKNKLDCSSKKIIIRNDYKFNELENFHCRYELSRLLKEQFYLDNTNNINLQNALILKRKRKAYIKNYKIINKETIKKQNRNLYNEIKTITCLCGGKYKDKNSSKKLHLKTLKHKKYIDNNINE